MSRRRQSALLDQKKPGFFWSIRAGSRKNGSRGMDPIDLADFSIEAAV
jgi:hypothetical protein